VSHLDRNHEKCSFEHFFLVVSVNDSLFGGSYECYCKNAPMLEERSIGVSWAYGTGADGIFACVGMV
jgi:hypothetical protein